MTTIRRGVLAVVLLLAMASLPLAPTARAQSRPAERPAAPAPAPDSKALLRALEDAFVSVADRATPSVVNVSVKLKPEAAQEEGPSPEMEERFREFFGPELFERFFRRRAPREDGRAAGSGVIVDARGYILTNNHVVENASAIEVRLSDDRKFKATLVGRDARTDLAVLKVESSDPLPVAELGDSDRLRVGQWAIAIGNPFGLDRTVTAGIISATGRTHVGVATYEAFIQTDASINPGNSGGPLLNLDGRVIGINTAIVSSGQGIGFAIPITMARDIMTQLIARGRVVRGWLGVVIQDLTPELAASFGVKEDAGVLVAEVMKDGPAAAAGLKPGDVITGFGGSPIKDVTDLQKRVAAVEPGRPARPEAARAQREAGRAAHRRGAGRGRERRGRAGPRGGAAHAGDRPAESPLRPPRAPGHRGGAGEPGGGGRHQAGRRHRGGEPPAGGRRGRVQADRGGAQAGRVGPGVSPAWRGAQRVRDADRPTSLTRVATQ